MRRLAGYRPLGLGGVETFRALPSAAPQAQKPHTSGHDSRRLTTHCTISCADTRYTVARWRNRTSCFKRLTHARAARARTVRRETRHTRVAQPSAFKTSSTSPTDLPGVPLRRVASFCREALRPSVRYPAQRPRHKNHTQVDTTADG